MEYLKIVKNKIFNFIFIIFLLNLFCYNTYYAKSIDLNGIKVSIESEVMKQAVGKGAKVKEDNKFNDGKENLDEEESDIENISDETTESKTRDEKVVVSLTIRNNNPYEAANVTVEEIAPSGFRQLESGKIDKIVNIKLESKTEEKIKYTYRYHQSFLKDQNNTIQYDEDGNIIEGSRNVNQESNDKNIENKIDNNKEHKNINEGAEDLKKGIFGILKFIITFIICIVILFVFIMVYKTIKGNDDSFFDNVDGFRCISLFLLLSILINICFSRIAVAKNVYEPQIYEYGKNYEKVIYEPVYFNDGLYSFAYKVSFSFDSTYVISDEDYEIDTDRDGLIDALEYQYMTDKNNVDSDNDGINDYFEVMFLDYNPLSEDTFKDGIKDGDRDYDSDGLTNIEEINYETDLFNVDTDYDSLTDYDEIKVYNTDPLSIDTDEDFLSDSDELKLSLDPTKPRSDGTTLDSERKIEQVYDMTNVPEELKEGDIFISGISGSVSGNIDTAVRITKKNEEVFNSMSSYVQSGFEVSLKEGEKINVELNVNKVSDRKTLLTIVRFEDGTIEIIDTICDGDKLKASIGSGIYTVIDSEIALRDLNIFLKDYIGVIE